MISIFGTFDEDCLGRYCSKPEKPPEEKVLHSLIHPPQLLYFVTLVLLGSLLHKTVMCVSFYRIAIFVSIKQQLLGIEYGRKYSLQVL